MESKLAKALRLKNHPVAVYRSDALPEGAMQFREGVWGCVIAMLNTVAKKGRTAAFCRERVECIGGRAGLGLPDAITYSALISSSCRVADMPRLRRIGFFV